MTEEIFNALWDKVFDPIAQTIVNQIGAQYICVSDDCKRLVFTKYKAKNQEIKRDFMKSNVELLDRYKLAAIFFNIIISTKVLQLKARKKSPKIAFLANQIMGFICALAFIDQFRNQDNKKLCVAYLNQIITKDQFDEILKRLDCLESLPSCHTIIFSNLFKLLVEKHFDPQLNRIENP